MEYLSRVFLDKHTKKYLKRLSIKTQFKIELLLPFTGCKKVLGKSLGKSEGKGGSTEEGEGKEVALPFFGIFEASIKEML